MPAAESFAAQVRAALQSAKRTARLLWVDAALDGDIAALSAATRAYHEARLSQGYQLLIPVHVDDSEPPMTFPALGGVALEHGTDECVRVIVRSMERA